MRPPRRQNALRYCDFGDCEQTGGRLDNPAKSYLKNLFGSHSEMVE